MFSLRATTIAALIFIAATPAAAFTARPLAVRRADAALSRARAPTESSVVMMAEKKFKWNINANRSPFGFAENAEVWNSRVAMMSFVYLFIQEAIFGPILKSGQSMGSLAMSGAFVVGWAGVTALIFANQENDQVSEINVDNIEDYM
eukprot:CAMPEP_0172583888 /NCGR_PEP_ID=MMETSP1068-20121228/3428_1 /TAXON_ID=35684 /ORGANISM="Pseudopedinella elastica, Strain CCMP716" /LENGTH=146 /DNA_ID=CAMNT_0013377847 /DNA_START=83 /DNA_END=523 /DNA_ORIENTATION=+